MIFSDRDIRLAVKSGEISIDPFDDAKVQPASYDLTLGTTFQVMEHRGHHIDPRQDNTGLYTRVEVEPDHPFTLRPGNLVLGCTNEWVTISRRIQGGLDGKSSLARLGLMVHQTGGFFDPGWDGRPTLEFSCVCPNPILLWPGMKIAQMCFRSLTSPADFPYGSPELGSKYQLQAGPEPSLYHLNDADHLKR